MSGIVLDAVQLRNIVAAKATWFCSQCDMVEAAMWVADAVYFQIGAQMLRKLSKVGSTFWQRWDPHAVQYTFENRRISCQKKGPNAVLCNLVNPICLN